MQDKRITNKGKFNEKPLIEQIAIIGGVVIAFLLFLMYLCIVSLCMSAPIIFPCPQNATCVYPSLLECVLLIK